MFTFVEAVIRDRTENVITSQWPSCSLIIKELSFWAKFFQICLCFVYNYLQAKHHIRFGNDAAKALVVLGGAKKKQ